MVYWRGKEIAVGGRRHRSHEIVLGMMVGGKDRGPLQDGEGRTGGGGGHRCGISHRNYLEIKILLGFG